MSGTWFWCKVCRCTHDHYPCPDPAVKMDREKAIAIVGVWPGPPTAGAFVDALAALGILKLEERTPKQTIQDTLANLVLQAHENADPKMSGWRVGWRVGPYAAQQILNAIDDAGFFVGKTSRRA
jgi:hypothetical protein